MLPSMKRVTEATLTEIETRAKRYLSTHPREAEVPKDEKGDLGGTLMKGFYPIGTHMPQVYAEYYAAVEPEVILSLIEELREAREKK
jgi:hypothetical protein